MTAGAAIMPHSDRLRYSTGAPQVAESLPKNRDGNIGAKLIRLSSASGFHSESRALGDSFFRVLRVPESGVNRGANESSTCVEHRFPSSKGCAKEPLCIAKIRTAGKCSAFWITTREGIGSDRVTRALETKAALASGSACMKVLNVVLRLLFYGLRALGRSRMAGSPVCALQPTLGSWISAAHLAHPKSSSVRLGPRGRALHRRRS